MSNSTIPQSEPQTPSTGTTGKKPSAALRVERRGSIRPTLLGSPPPGAPAKGSPYS